MTNEFTALGGIMAPGTSVFGYRRGDHVRTGVVEAWGLTVGEDVVEGDLPEEETVAQVDAVTGGRPADDDTRAAWEGWAIRNGMTGDQASEASIEDLQAVEAQAPGEAGSEQGGQPQRPADSAAKSEWVTYAIALGADEQWARDSATTKANLQAYEPPVGDTVAEAATEAQG